MTIKEFFKSEEKLAIHCSTEEKAKKLLKAFDRAGYFWFSGKRYTSRTLWKNHKENTCYSNDHQYCMKAFYQCRGYKILEFEEIDLKSDNEFKMTIEEFFESNEKLAIHCPTEEQAEVLLNAFDKEGYRWFNEYRLDGSSWIFFEEETCYDNKYQYTKREWYENNGYRIIDFEEIEI